MKEESKIEVSVCKLLSLSGEGGVQAIPSDFPYLDYKKTNKDIRFRAMTILTKRIDCLMTLTELWT
jgi:hypothetical protein